MSELRLAELLGSLSLVTDLARHHPPEEALRAGVLATTIARDLGLDTETISQVFYTALLRYVGCTAPMHEYTAAMGAAEVDIRARGDMVDFTNPREALRFLVSIGSTVPAWRKPVYWAATLARAGSVQKVGVQADCEVARRMAARFRLPNAVGESLYQCFERWDGHGLPLGISGEAISLPARLTCLAFAAVMFHEVGGRQIAVDAVRRWSGRSLDPELAEAFLHRSDALLEAIEGEDVWLDSLACEPSPQRLVRDQQLDEVCRGFADFVDLKSVYLHGHSTGVAALAEGTARAANLAEPDLTALRRAGLLHDLGRAAVPTLVWEKAGRLSTAEWEAVRLHTYHTERILSRAPALAPLAQLAGMHHERLDGSGYHRGAAASAQPKTARILAVADVYQALTADRPHRRALAPDAAARVLEAQPGLDRDAVAALLEAAGQRSTARRRDWPAALTDREVEVLRLLARGQTMPQIAGALFISGSTVHTHVAHIYEKAGVSTRASAALFAMENDLLDN